MPIRFCLALALALCALPLSARADTKAFTLVNTTSKMIVKLYVRPIEGGGERIELLKKKGLYGGKSRKLTITDNSNACAYWVWTVFEDNSFYDKREAVDFCEYNTYTFSD